MYNLFHNLQLVEVCQYVVGRSRKEARVQRHKTGLGSGDWGGPVSAGSLRIGPDSGHKGKKDFTAYTGFMTDRLCFCDRLHELVDR
jgi:hypothetical protein